MIKNKLILTKKIKLSTKKIKKPKNATAFFFRNKKKINTWKTNIKEEFDNISFKKRNQLQISSIKKSSDKLILKNEGTYGLGINLVLIIFKSLGYNKLIRKIHNHELMNQSCNFSDFFRRFIYLKSSDYLNYYLKESKNIVISLRITTYMYNYKGMRYLKGLPVRGQRTKTNRKTSKARKLFLFVPYNIKIDIHLQLWIKSRTPLLLTA